MSVDVIGPLIDDEVLLEGWHVNLTPEALAAHPGLEAWRVTPATLRRVWAGDDPTAPSATVALRFAEAIDWLAVAPADA